MDIRSVGELLKYIASGAVMGLLWWDKVYKPAQEKKHIERKKAEGKFVSWEDLRKDIDEMKLNLAKMDYRFVEHMIEYKNFREGNKIFMEREDEENIKIGKMEVAMESISDRVETENNHIFSQLKSLHEKFDAMTKIIIEKQK